MDKWEAREKGYRLGVLAGRRKMAADLEMAEQQLQVLRTALAAIQARVRGARSLTVTPLGADVRLADALERLAAIEALARSSRETP